MKKRKLGAGIFLILSIAMALALTWMTKVAEPRIAENNNKKIQAFVHKMVPTLDQSTQLQSFQLLAPNYLKMGDVQTATRVWQGNTPTQIIFTAISEKAYKDRIGIITAFDNQCTVLNVDIITQRETPGLGDQYKQNDFAWLKSLVGKKHDTQWSLKPSGEIDTWTGATITPKAIVETLERMQQLCIHEHDLLFSNEDPLYLEIGHPETPGS